MSYFEERYRHVYAENRHFYKLKARELLGCLRRFDPAPFQSMLDLGCGCGDLMAAVKALESDIRVAGIDQDHEMIERAQTRQAGDFRCANVLKNVPEFSGRFDVVCSLELLEHLEVKDHHSLFERYRHYLRPGGMGLVLVPNAGHPLLGGWLSWSDYTHRSHFTPESLAQLLRSEGIREARVEPWYLAGSKILLSLRVQWGSLASRLLRAVVSTVSTQPRAQDAFVMEAWPLSSHVVATFRLPK